MNSEATLRLIVAGTAVLSLAGRPARAVAKCVPEDEGDQLALSGYLSE